MNDYFKEALTKSLLRVSFIFLIYTQLYSQKKIFRGYFIGKSGDTVKGTFPHYTQWSKNPGTVQFVPSASSAAVELTPENTLKFFIENYDTYLSYTGQRMTNPIDFEQATTSKDTFGFPDQYAPISAFLRLVAKTGNLELFVLTDQSRTNFFYRLNHQPLQELKFKMYYDQNRVNEVYEYRQQLNSLFKDEIEKRTINASLEKVEYTEESLSALLEKLTPPEKRKMKVKNPAAGIIVAAGLSTNFFKVSGDKNLNQVSTKYNTSFSPLLSVGYMSPLNRGFGKFFVYPQLKLYTYKNTGEVIADALRKITTFKTSLIVSPVLNVGANLVNTDPYKLFVSAGAGMMFLLNNKEQQESILTYNNPPYQSYEVKLSNLSYNVNLSTGVMLKKVIATATYNLPSPAANFVFYTPYYSSIQITVGYKL